MPVRTMDASTTSNLAVCQQEHLQRSPSDSPVTVLPMKTLGERLSAQMKAKGLNHGALVKRIQEMGGPKFSLQVIQQLIAGDSKGSKHLHWIARALEVSAVWLETGQ